MAQLGRLQSLQILRFAAALGVIWEHACTRTNLHHRTGGAFGVDLFFVLSGYVISLAAETKRDGFLRDRVTRIFPIYWLWAGGWLAFAVARGDSFDSWSLFTTLTLLPAPTPFVLGSYVPVSWSLSFELLFYGAVWLALRGMPKSLMLGVYAALAVASFLLAQPLLHFFGSPMVIEFLLGVVIYRAGRTSPTIGALAVAVACVTFPLIPLDLTVPQVSLMPYEGLGRAFLFGPVAALVVWGTAQFECAGKIWRPLVLLGDASYSMYLSHLLLIEIAGSILDRSPPPIIATAACVGVGLVVYLLLERPLLRLSRRIALPRRRALAPLTPGLTSCPRPPGAQPVRVGRLSCVDRARPCRRGQRQCQRSAETQSFLHAAGVPRPRLTSTSLSPTDQAIQQD